MVDCKNEILAPAALEPAGVWGENKNLASLPSLAVSTLVPDFSFEISPANPPRRSRSQKNKTVLQSTRMKLKVNC